MNTSKDTMKRSSTMYFYWDDVYICKFKIDKKNTRDLYDKKANELILTGLRSGYSLQDFEQKSRLFLKGVARRRENKQSVYRSDCVLVCFTILALIKLQKVIESDVIIELIKRKVKSASHTS